MQQVDYQTEQTHQFLVQSTNSNQVFKIMRPHALHLLIGLVRVVTLAQNLSSTHALLIHIHTRINNQHSAMIPTISRIQSTTQLNEAALPFAGSGPRQVDMNVYNLPLDIIEQEWTANLVAKTVDDDGGIFLGTKNAREYFPDVVSMTVPRPSDGTGLGIMLQEIAGGRGDGLGITVVSGLVEGGYIESCNVDMLPGDSITSISVVRNLKSMELGLTEKAEITSASTECLGYDATVEAIVNLPPCVDEGESMVINMKRLRRKPRIRINLKFPPSQKQSDETVELFAGENLRLGMLVRGVKLNDPLAKRFDTKSEGNCGAGGLCRTCSVSVLRGGDLLNPQKVAEKQMLGDNPRWRLGCKAFVGYGMKEGEISLQVNPGQW